MAKLSRERALRFLQVSVGIDDENEGRMETYWDDVLGMGLAPTAKEADDIFGFLQRGDPTEQQTPTGKAKMRGLRLMVAHLRALADAMDPAGIGVDPAADDAETVFDDEEEPR